MYTKTVRLPYTLWYDGHDKIFRMDISTILPEEHYEDGKKYVGKIRNVQVGGYNVDGDIQPPPDGNHSYLEVTEFATAVYNEQKHYVDITLKSFPSFNADGEIALSIDYELAKGIEEYITDYSYQKKEVTIIIPIRSHENPSKDPGRFNNGIGIDKMDVRNGFAYTVGASEEPVVFSFELIERDITDEFITNGQALDMVKNKAIESANLVANDSGLGLSLNWKSFGQLSWDNLKQYLDGSNSTEFTTTTLEDIIAMLNNTSENIRDEITNNIVTGLQSHINVQENSSKDIDIYYNADFYTAQGQHINEPRKLFTIPRSLLGGEGQAVDTESIKNSILSVIQQQIPNATTIKQEILADVNPRIPDKETLKNEILASVPTPSATPYELTPDKMTQAIRDNELEMKEFIDIVFGYSTYSNNFSFVREANTFNVYYRFNLQDGNINHFSNDKIKLLSIPFSILQNISEGTQIDVASLKNEIYSKVGENITYNDLYNILTSFSNPEDHTYANEIITALLGKYYNQSDEYYTQHPEELENGFGNKLINHTTNILDKITKDAADREKAGKLFQKLLDAETLNVVEKTDGYELSYTGDVNKVLVKIPKQAITVSQEVITAALTENVVTETIKPTLDKSYYSKEEVDNLIKKLKEELTAEDYDTHSAEEHPQQ